MTNIVAPLNFKVPFDFSNIYIEIHVIIEDGN
jgi:hypothetical protein